MTDEFKKALVEAWGEEERFLREGGRIDDAYEWGFHAGWNASPNRRVREMQSTRYIPTTEVPPEQTNASLRKLLREAHGEIRRHRESARFYEERLRPTIDQETGATEDEIDRLTLALELATQDKKRFATNLHDLQCAVREAMVRIEAEKFDLSKSTSSHEVLFTKCAQRDLDIVKDCCGDLL